MNPLIQAYDAKVIISKQLANFTTTDCSINASSGRILREDIVADRPLPPYNRSMMDGYALRLSDIAKVQSFKIASIASAGSQEKVLGKTIGCCIEIMTGAVLPSGADIVIPYEETEILATRFITFSEGSVVVLQYLPHKPIRDYGLFAAKPDE